MRNKLKNPLPFILAGKACFSLYSHKTGKHFTYRVSEADRRSENEKKRWFVSVLTGSDNETVCIS
jgi:hypothetical protein